MTHTVCYPSIEVCRLAWPHVRRAATGIESSLGYITNFGRGYTLRECIEIPRRLLCLRLNTEQLPVGFAQRLTTTFRETQWRLWTMAFANLHPTVTQVPAWHFVTTIP
jgi:hypothetical protein